MTTELQPARDGRVLCTDLFGGLDVNPADVVLTHDKLAAAIVQHFGPTGRILDPCRGGGAFWKHMPGAEWCEIREGVDFMAWTEPVDWIVSNPPYSIFLDWLKHSMSLAPDIVYLIPLFKVWQSEKVMRAIQEWGGLRETLIVGSGRKIGFPTGFSIGAVHFQRGWHGDMRVRWIPPND
jgi:hypothetical protein